MSTLIESDLNFQGLAHLVRALLNPIANAGAEPGSPGHGEIWFRTDTGVIRFVDNSGTVHTIANLDAVVNSFAAGDGTITVGGTATAPTAKVAKTLDHTYITDFDTEVRTSRLDQFAAPTATVSFNSQILTGIADAVNPTDAVNLESAQKLLAQISDRAAVDLATTAALPASTYANGASGVGATLTGNANGALSVDGVAVTVGQRILVQNQASGFQNGVYTVTATGGSGAAFILTRAADFNASNNISTGVMIPVEANSSETAGATNNGKVFISVAPSPVVVGTSAVTFSLIGSAYTAGTGLTLTGTQFSLTVPVSIANGGTGATTASQARDSTHLGAQTTAPAGAGSAGVQSIAAEGIITKVKAVIGDGATTAITVNHNLGTTDVIVEVHPHGGGGNKVIVDTEPVDNNNVLLTFNVAPAASAFDCVIAG